jgi:hypothetical protein
MSREIYGFYVANNGKVFLMASILAYVIIIIEFTANISFILKNLKQQAIVAD